MKKSVLVSLVFSMVKTYLVYFYVVLSLITSVSCRFPRNNHHASAKTEEIQEDIYVKNSSLKISDLIVLLNQNIDSLPDIFPYKAEKILIEDEEETGVSWKGIKFSNNDSLIILVETDWVTVNKVSRVTVCSDRIREDKIYVGQFVGNIKELISDNIPVSPDGELLLDLKEHSEIHLLLDISNHPSLFYGVSSLLDIPDDVKIESIVIYDAK